jgi:hypothetical protein
MVLGREWPLRISGRGTAAGCSVIGAIGMDPPMETGVEVSEPRGVCGALCSSQGWSWEIKSKSRAGLRLPPNSAASILARSRRKTMLDRVVIEDGRADVDEDSAALFALRGDVDKGRRMKYSARTVLIGQGLG